MDPPYRDALGAAQHRIAELEAELAAKNAPRAAALNQKNSRNAIAVVVVLICFAAGLGAAGMMLTKRAPQPNVSVTGIASSSGWVVTFHVPANATHISYRLPGDAEFYDLGDMTYARDQNGNTPALATTTLSYERIRGKQTPIELKYTVNGHVVGPRTVYFEPASEGVSSTQTIFRMIGQWVTVTPSGDGSMIYFTTMLAYKHALASIRYSVDNESLDHEVTFTPSDRPGIDPNDLLYVTVPGQPRFVFVELTFKDGSRMTRKVDGPGANADPLGVPRTIPVTNRILPPQPPQARPADTSGF